MIYKYSLTLALLGAFASSYSMEHMNQHLENLKRLDPEGVYAFMHTLILYYSNDIEALYQSQNIETSYLKSLPLDLNRELMCYRILAMLEDFDRFRMLDNSDIVAYLTTALTSINPRIPFQLLGLQNNASAAEIATAFKQLARQWHPDKHTRSTEKEKELAIARFKLYNACREFCLLRAQ